MTLFDQLYETLLGNLEEPYAVPGIENAFAPGSFCDEKYAQMRSAYERLCQRLGAKDEDPDLEIIVDSFTDIQNHIAEKMFLLGLGASDQQKNTPG